MRTKRSWPGTSTTLSLRPGGQLERREAELDRDAARALLRQAVGVRPRSAPRPAPSCRDRCARRSRASAASGRVSSPARRARAAHDEFEPRPRRSCAGRAALRRRCTRATTGGSPARRRACSSSGADRARTSPRPPGPRARAAAATRRPRGRPRRDAPRRRRRRRRDRRRAGARARASSSACERAQHLQHRDVATERCRVAVQPQRRLERRERELVDPQRARQRVRAHALDRLAAGRRRSRPAGPPSSLSPEKQTSVRAGARRSRAPAGSSRSTARGRRCVVPARRSRGRRSPAAACRASAQSASIATSSVKPTVRKLEACTRISAAVSRTDRALVVGEPGAVRGADLDQPRARRGEDLGDPEGAADLDQLAARDHDLAARRRARRAQAAPRRRCC